MFFDLQSWRDRFEKARTDNNVVLVRDLLDEIAEQYQTVAKDRRNVSPRFTLQ